MLLHKRAGRKSTTYQYTRSPSGSISKFVLRDILFLLVIVLHTLIVSCHSVITVSTEMHRLPTFQRSAIHWDCSLTFLFPRKTMLENQIGKRLFLEKKTTEFWSTDYDVKFISAVLYKLNALQLSSPLF